MLSQDRYYTGIGSRETPKDVLTEMERLGANLYNAGYILRSGGAPGADQAFEWGVALQVIDNFDWPAEIYLPWGTFQHGNRSWINPRRTEPQPEAYEIAERYHPAWKYLKPWGKKFHARNVHQVLGYDVTNPVLSVFVACWTKDAKGGGGTGQAIRIAKAYDVPVYDFADRIQYWDLLERFNGSFII